MFAFFLTGSIWQFGVVTLVLQIRKAVCSMMLVTQKLKGEIKTKIYSIF